MRDLAHELSRKIEQFRARGERRLPPERALADELATSRGSLRNELAKLVEQGVIERKLGRGGGSFIQDVAVGAYVEEEAEPPFTVTRSLDAVVGVPTFLSDQGFEPSTRIIRTEERVANARERGGLGLDLDERVIVIRRLRSANSVPLSLEEMTLPFRVFPGLLDRELTSMYALMRSVYGVEVGRAEEAINVRTATPAAAYLLNTVIGSSLFDIRRLMYDRSGRPIELSRDLFRADITRLTVTEGVSA